MPSSYFRNQKQPYAYSFRRCSHNQPPLHPRLSHVVNGVAVIATYTVCPVCNTLREPATHVKTKVLQQRSDGL